MIIAFTVIGVVFGALGLILFALKIFKLKHEPSIKQIDVSEMLPCKNCGKCGSSTCLEFAEEILKDINKINMCTELSKNQCQVIKSKLMEVKMSPKEVAFVFCKGGELCDDKYNYYGTKTCKEENLLFNGRKSCEFACLGCGDCVKICPVDAISISQRGCAVVDSSLCISCGNCINICPKHLIGMVPSKQKLAIVCNNKKISGDTAKYCEVSCSHCGECIKVCPTHAIQMEDGIPKIDNEKCVGCMLCMRVCERRVISRI